MINGIISKEHLTSHPMKSIVAQGEMDLYFGDSTSNNIIHDDGGDIYEEEEEYEEEGEEDNEGVVGIDEGEGDYEEEGEEDQISPRDVLGTGEKTYACPYCARIGYTEQLLVNHVGTLTT